MEKTLPAEGYNVLIYFNIRHYITSLKLEKNIIGFHVQFRKNSRKCKSSVVDTQQYYDNI